MRTYSVRLATSDDVPALMELRKEAERWLAEAGVDQWSDQDLGDRAMQSWLTKIRAGQTWVFLDQAGAAVATISRGQADQDFWREGDDLESGFYVYKLIVGRSEAGQGLGRRILDWASLIAAAEDKAWLRLDVWRNNKRLQRYYEKAGFAHVRTASPEHRLSGWMAQREAGTVLHPERLLPIIPSPLPAGFHDQLVAAATGLQAVSRQVSSLLAQLKGTSTPTTGRLRWSYDRALKELLISNSQLHDAVQHAETALAEVRCFPASDNPAWASAPRPPVQLLNGDGRPR
ncbi:GNAT family N-acetyltransferase [Streptomyces sp. MJM8645]|uniref:GNAT family N-acetyltransferase n=1 Tax=Streptomyces sp. MJM8645 TaxID=1120523 RepID=UPI0007AFDBB6|nr:GNAT family N-acetyltransferase [Streptomyces sp. MJM8645]